MSKYFNTKNGYIHLYNPKKEGLGAYDVHYINAYKKNKRLKLEPKVKEGKRYAAWFLLSEALPN